MAAQQTNETPTQDVTFTIESKVNVVLVPVLVRDAQGRAVNNLKKEDFQVFDKDRPQVISGFTIQKRAGVESNTKAGEAAPVIPSAEPPPAMAPERFIVFLFDDIHLSAGDLAQAQNRARGCWQGHWPTRTWLLWLPFLGGSTAA